MRETLIVSCLGEQAYIDWICTRPEGIRWPSWRSLMPATRAAWAKVAEARTH